MKYKIEKNNIVLYQDTQLQSASFDSFLLADFIKINRKFKNVLEIGSGNGVISILIAKKTKANITGVEILETSHKLALQNAKANNVNINFINQDIYTYKLDEMQVYDAIICNPPYFIENNINQMKKENEKRIARNEYNLKIEDIIKIANRLLKNSAHLYLIFRADRLDEIFKYFEATNMRIKNIKFVCTKNGNEALFCLLDAVKGAKRGIKVEYMKVEGDL